MTDRTGFLGDTSPRTVGHGSEEPVPWKVICPMEERMRFITSVNESDETFTELCARFGISRKTGYKWVERYEADGVAGLAEGRPPPLVASFMIRILLGVASFVIRILLGERDPRLDHFWRAEVDHFWRAAKPQRSPNPGRVRW